jgi:hypothetical protein
MIIHRVCFETIIFYSNARVTQKSFVLHPYYSYMSRFVLLFVYICIVAGDPLKEGKGWYPIYKFISISNIFATVPSNDVHCQRHMCGLIRFQWFELSLEVIVRFVDIGGIVDHHCLSILFNNYLSMYIPWQWGVNNNIIILFSNLFYILICNNIQK